MFDPLLTVTTERLALRPFGLPDADRIRSIVESGAQFLPPGAPGHVASVSQWLANGVHELQRSGQGVHLAMTDHDGLIVGAISLFKTAWGAGTTEVGYGVHPLHRGRGFATEAVRGLVAHVFAETTLRRVDLTANLDNLPSLSVARKAGFTWEGVLRAAVLEDDGPHDLVIFGRLRDDDPAADDVLPRTELRTPRLLIRPLHDKDVPDLAATGADPLTQAMTGVPRDYDQAQARAFIATAERMRLRGHGIAWAAEEVAGGRLAVSVDLRDVDWANRTAEIGYMAAPWARGQGYTTETVAAIGRWLLRERRFHRLKLRAATTNPASQRVAEKAGFVREGVERGALRGEDLVVFSLIPSDLQATDDNRTP
ncbi:GNAT family N-acetyltransferase [Nonomuraea sp. NPDC048826]|uniref:GNAT family N-acetyltransferase n=1 Tax=Nonomuraea sp. NPDC048826 TaxID=3364347 RepID=UPI00371D5F54